MKTSWTAGIYNPDQLEIGTETRMPKHARQGFMHQPARRFESTIVHQQKRQGNNTLKMYSTGNKPGWNTKQQPIVPPPTRAVDLSWSSTPPKAQQNLDPEFQYWMKSETNAATSGNTDNVTCNICHRAFSSKSGLYYHKRSHNEGKFRCIFCQRGFTRRVLMNQHVAKIHPDKAYQYFTTLNRSKYDTRAVRDHDQGI